MRDWEVVSEDGVGERVAVASLDASLLVESRWGVSTLMVEDQKERVVRDER